MTLARYFDRVWLISSTSDIPASGLVPGTLFSMDDGSALYQADTSTTYVSVGTGSSTWTPTTPATPYAWYKADAGVYKDAGVTLAADTETVQQWNDQSGNSRHLGQSTSGKRPVYRTGLLNSLPIVRFDNVDDCLTLASAAISTLTIGVVCRAGSVGIVYEHGPDTGGNDGSFIYTSTPSVAVRRSGVLSSRQNFAGWGSQNNWNVIIQEFLTGNHNTHCMLAGSVWNVSNTDTGNDPGTSTTTDTLNVGSRNNGASLPLNGDIAELIVYTPSISFQHANKLSAYLGSRWNIPSMTI